MKCYESAGQYNASSVANTFFFGDFIALDLTAHGCRERKRREWWWYEV